MKIFKFKKRVKPFFKPKPIRQSLNDISNMLGWLKFYAEEANIETKKQPGKKPCSKRLKPSECTLENEESGIVAVNFVGYRKSGTDGITALAYEFIKIINSKNITYAKAELALKRAEMLLKNGMISANENMNAFLENRSDHVDFM